MGGNVSTKKETVKICDVCKKRVSDEGETYYGGHPHQGWFEVHQRGGATDLASLQMKRDWDICSVKCLKMF